MTDNRRRDIRTFTCLGSALRILAINFRILPLRFAIFCLWCDFMHQVRLAALSSSSPFSHTSNLEIALTLPHLLCSQVSQRRTSPMLQAAVDAVLALVQRPWRIFGMISWWIFFSLRLLVTPGCVPWFDRGYYFVFPCPWFPP